jgi:hypothetical protein
MTAASPPTEKRGEPRGALDRLVTLRTVLLASTVTAVVAAGAAVGVSVLVVKQGPPGRTGQVGPPGESIRGPAGPPSNVPGPRGFRGPQGRTGPAGEVDEEAVLDVLRSRQDEIENLATESLCSQLQLSDNPDLNDVGLLGC